MEVDRLRAVVADLTARQEEGQRQLHEAVAKVSNLTAHEVDLCGQIREARAAIASLEAKYHQVSVERTQLQGAAEGARQNDINMRVQLDAATRAASEHEKQRQQQQQQLQSAEALAVQRAEEAAAALARERRLTQDNSELLVARSQLEAQLVVYTQAGPDRGSRESALDEELKKKTAEMVDLARRGNEYCVNLKKN